MKPVQGMVWQCFGIAFSYADPVIFTGGKLKMVSGTVHKVKGLINYKPCMSIVQYNRQVAEI
jgi:hypothetical protein